MGANTYIGNGPNFMVRSIAEERGVSMPTFVGYMLYSGAVLIPVFVVITLVFFRTSPRLAITTMTGRPGHNLYTEARRQVALSAFAAHRAG